MRKNLLTITLLMQACFCAPFVLGQQTGDSKADPPNKALTRVQEMSALVESKNAGAESIIRQSLSDDNWYVRAGAARALGRLGDKSSAKALASLIGDQNWLVRDAALEALAAIKALPDAAVVQQLLSSPDPYVRARAARALGAVNYAPAGDALIKALGDKDEFVRRAAASALGGMRAT